MGRSPKQKKNYWKRINGPLERSNGQVDLCLFNWVASLFLTDSYFYYFQNDALIVVFTLISQLVYSVVKYI